MSKVIKAALWQEARTIEPPPPPPPPPKAESEEAPAFDQEAYDNMLAEIKAKEERANAQLSDAKISIQVMKQEAKAEAKKIVDDAKVEAEALREQAKEDGHKEGFEAGREEGEQHVRQELESMIKDAGARATKLLQDAKAATRDYVQGAEKDIVDLAMEAVEKVLPEHFIDKNQMVLPIVREALLRVKDQKEFKVRVAPQCYDMVLLARDEFRRMLTAPDATLEFESDESLVPGDCIIETPNGSVDARLQTQIELIRQAVKDVML